jgi:hypothetical protein
MHRILLAGLAALLVCTSGAASGVLADLSGPAATLTAVSGGARCG